MVFEGLLFGQASFFTDVVQVPPQNSAPIMLLQDDFSFQTAYS